MDLEQVVMNIVAQSGQAKGLVYRAMEALGSGDPEGALRLLEESETLLKDVHRLHYRLLTEIDPAALRDSRMLLLMIHAEDIFSSTMSEKEMLKSLVRNRLLSITARTKETADSEEGGERSRATRGDGRQPGLDHATDPNRCNE